MEGEAVTTTGWTSKTTFAPQPQPVSRARTGPDPSNSRPERCAIVGAGRLGHALAAALRDAGLTVDGPLGRGADPADADVVLLCVPDAEIAAAAAAVPSMSSWSATAPAPRPSTPSAAREAFSLHPLMTVPPAATRAFAGAGCAIAGSTPSALRTATALAEALEMRPVEVADDDRAAYHAAASIAANFLVTLEHRPSGSPPPPASPASCSSPLARAALENWAAQRRRARAHRPVARGDEATIARHRAAIEERAPDLLDTFDALVAASRVVAAT